MGKRSFVVSLDYNAGVLFRKFRDEGGLTNSDIFKEFFSDTSAQTIVDNLPLAVTPKLLRTDCTQQTSLTMSLDEDLMPEFISRVEEVSGYTQYEGIPCLTKMAVWARVCVYRFLTKNIEGCVTNAPESDVPIENAVNFLTEYNRIHESIVL